MWITDIKSDNDSIFIVSGKDNKINKYEVNYSLESISKSSVSGLHSRVTDSHKICYNSDDDEFIIVSDSGIVYSYDKTTLTTLDTLIRDEANGTFSECMNVEYLDGTIFTLMNTSNNTGLGSIYNLNTNTQIGINVYLFDSYDVRLMKSDQYFCIYFYNDILAGNDLLEYYNSTGILVKFKLTNKINNHIFDLDYIDYLPN
jgi:hypothetical protein